MDMQSAWRVTRVGFAMTLPLTGMADPAEAHGRHQSPRSILAKCLSDITEQTAIVRSMDEYGVVIRGGWYRAMSEWSACDYRGDQIGSCHPTYAAQIRLRVKACVQWNAPSWKPW